MYGRYGTKLACTKTTILIYIYVINNIVSAIYSFISMTGTAYLLIQKKSCPQTLTYETKCLKKLLWIEFLFEHIRPIRINVSIATSVGRQGINPDNNKMVYLWFGHLT